MISIVALAAILQGLDGNVAYIGIIAISGIAGYSIKEAEKIE